MEFQGIQDSLTSSKEHFVENTECSIVSEKRTVFVDGKEHNAKIIMIDFREDKEQVEQKKDSLVIHIHGVGNSSRGFNDAADSGDFSRQSSTLEYQAIKEASSRKGVYFQCQLLELPVVEETPSFREDAKVNMAFLKDFGFLPENFNVSVSGYSEGAAIARQLASLIEVQQQSRTETHKNTLKLFSLAGIVPVENIFKSFSDHVWDQVVMAEAARRMYSVLSDTSILQNEIKTKDEQFEIVGRIFWELTLGKKKSESLLQLKEALNGNLDQLADVVKRMASDVLQSSRHTKKYAKEEFVNLGSSWDVEIRLPQRDSVYPIKKWLNSMIVSDGGAFESLDREIVERYFVDTIFPNVHSLSLHLFGGAWYEAKNYHTGPTEEPELFYSGVGDDVAVFNA